MNISNLSLINVKNHMIADNSITPLYQKELENNNPIFIIYANPRLADIVPILFQKCIEDLKGKRSVRCLSLNEYREAESDTLLEVDVDSPFSVSDFFNHLGKYKDDMILVYSAVLDSTQTFLQKYCQNIQNVVCTTEIQTQGRGRKTNAWVSPVGCLMFSFKSAMTNPQYICLTQYLEALVTCKAINEMDELKGKPLLDVTIKWPNDVYMNKRTKFVGIICQSSYSNGYFDITSGIGINVSNFKPTTCLEKEIEIKTGNRIHLSRGELLGHYMRIWNDVFPKFNKEGFGPFLSDYYELWLHSNQQVNVNTDTIMESVIIKGINENGFLVALTQEGKQVELIPDGNSFNFLEGLITKK